MNNLELSNMLIGKVQSKFNCTDVSDIVEFMRYSGLLSDKNVIKYLIKDEYYKRLKTGDMSGYSIKMDLAVEFETTYDHVSNIIYKATHITI